jgi:hypothetical protein
MRGTGNHDCVVDDPFAAQRNRPGPTFCSASDPRGGPSGRSGVPHRRHHAVFTTNPLERPFRDIHVAVQDNTAFMVHYEPAGKVMPGLRPADPGC